MIRQLVLAVLLGLGTVVGAACSPDPAASTGVVPVSIRNDTDVPVGLYVGGTWVGTYPAGAAVEARLPGPLRLPTTVELLAPSGAVLLSTSLNEAQHAKAAGGEYGVGESVGLPCGVLSLVVGTLGEGEALAPAASVAPGPCP